ncbi:MAG: MATE family efflux transporter [Sarcina sp.]
MEEMGNIFYLKEEKIGKAIRHLAIPTMIGMSVGTIYNILNAYFIGLTKSTLFLAVVTMGLSIFIILMAFGNMIGVGAGTYISRLLGENDFSKAKKIAKYATYGSIIFSILVAIIALIFINPIVRVIGATGIAFAPTKVYAQITFIGGFSLICNFTLEQLVRSEGATRESMYGMVISVIFSIIFDILFILVFKWNVYGAALSMVLANITACIYYLYYLNFKSQTLKGYLKIKGWINIKEQIEIFKIGFPELIQCAFMLVTTILVNNFAMRFGDGIVAGFGIAFRVSQLPDFLSMGN